MVPSDVIAGDVKVKLIGPCANVESYVLGLRYKERILWKLRRVVFSIRSGWALSIPHRQQDAPLPEAPQFKNIPVDNRDLFQLPTPGWNPEYNTTEWIAYKKTFENKDLWTVHEEERVAFEIKTTLVSAEEAGKVPVLKFHA